MRVGAIAQTTLVRCDDVTIVHGAGDARVIALDHVSVEVCEGERTGLWGPSGCGKTTLLHVLGGLVQPTSGDVNWETDPGTRSVPARAGRPAPGIGFVFQQPNLLPYFTAIENVQFAARVAGVTTTVAADLLALVGLTAKLDFLPGELSGGEQQRVSIARALARQPQVLLCDEPTGRLDSDTAHRVLDLVDRLQSSVGFALVVASHDPAVIARFAREIHLVDGCIVGEQVRS